MQIICKFPCGFAVAHILIHSSADLRLPQLYSMQIGGSSNEHVTNSKLACGSVEVIYGRLYCYGMSHLFNKQHEWPFQESFCFVANMRHKNMKWKCKTNSILFNDIKLMRFGCLACPWHITMSQKKQNKREWRLSVAIKKKMLTSLKSLLFLCI